MKIYIAEDEPLAAAKLKLFLEKAGVGSDVTLFSDGKQLQDALLSGELPQVIFLDIQMPNLTGLQFLQHLQSLETEGFVRPDIIITSAYDQYAIDGFNYGVTDYLLKPYTLDRLKQSLAKLRNKPSDSTPVSNQGPDHSATITLRCEGRTEMVHLSNIVCVEAVKDYTTFVLADQRRLTTLGTIGSFEQQLPASNFLRVQRSYIINLHHVISFTSLSVRLTTEIDVPIGKTYRESFETAIRTINR